MHARAIVRDNGVGAYVKHFRHVLTTPLAAAGAAFVLPVYAVASPPIPHFLVLLCSALPCPAAAVLKIYLQLPMWVDNDSMGDAQGFLAPPSGLFPVPLLPILGGKDGSDCTNGVTDVSSTSGTSSSVGGAFFFGGGGGGKDKGKDKSGKALTQRRRSVIGRFRFLGRLAARCLMDGQVRQQNVFFLFFVFTV